eukprot:jgi/Tetstr1/430336/TSEL_020161.t1
MALIPGNRRLSEYPLLFGPIRTYPLVTDAEDMPANIRLLVVIDNMLLSGVLDTNKANASLWAYSFVLDDPEPMEDTHKDFQPKTPLVRGKRYKVAVGLALVWSHGPRSGAGVTLVPP